ncbi:hypothetical protein ABZX92_36180, partial [Lentzea sp. NPDC006480]
MIAVTNSPVAAAAHEDCRPDGLYKTPGVDVPYCSVYDTSGRENLGPDKSRRVIGYFTSWRTGKNGQPGYLAKDIPWEIASGRISLGGVLAFAAILSSLYAPVQQLG